MDDQIPYYVEEEKDSFINKLQRVSTSFSSLVVAFILSNLLLKIISAQFARLLKYGVNFSYNQVLVTPYDYHYWSRTNIIITSFFPPVICLVLGLFIFNWLRIKSDWSSRFRILFFWVAVALVNMVLTHMLVAPLASPYNLDNGLYQTFAVVGAWFFVPQPIMFMGSLAALALSLGAGMLLRDEILRYSFSKKLIRTKAGMDAMVLQVYILPLVIAIIPALLLCTKTSFFTTIMQLVNLGVISIGIFIKYSVGISPVRCNRDDVLNRIPIVELSICGAIWLFVFLFFK